MRRLDREASMELVELAVAAKDRRDGTVYPLDANDKRVKLRGGRAGQWAGGRGGGVRNYC